MAHAAVDIPMMEDPARSRLGITDSKPSAAPPEIKARSETNDETAKRSTTSALRFCPGTSIAVNTSPWRGPAAHGQFGSLTIWLCKIVLSITSAHPSFGAKVTQIPLQATQQSRLIFSNQKKIFRLHKILCFLFSKPTLLPC
jgi:hypothetical protein